MLRSLHTSSWTSDLLLRYFSKDRAYTLKILRWESHRGAFNWGCLEVEDKRQCFHLVLFGSCKWCSQSFYNRKSKKTHSLRITSQAWGWATVEIKPLEHSNGSSHCQHLTLELREAQMRSAQLKSATAHCRKKEQNACSGKVNMLLNQQQGSITSVLFNALFFAMCLWSN